MNPSSNLAVEIKALTKKYDDFKAVNSLNLSIKKGEVFGLLGPNGAGKTTVLLMLLGLTEPTSGDCKVYGFDPKKETLKIKSIVGYLPERTGAYEHITAKQNLKYVARLNHISSKEIPDLITDVLQKVGLNDVEEIKVGKFSRGMKQRLCIANVLIKDPKVIFLDEPTQGLDPNGITDILNLLKKLNIEKDVTILIASHLIHQIEQICDRIGIMVNGKMVVQGKIDVLNRMDGQNWLIEIEALNLSDSLLERIKAIQGVVKIERDGEKIIIISDHDIRSFVSKYLIDNNVTINKFLLRDRTLDELYKKYSGVNK